MAENADPRLGATRTPVMWSYNGHVSQLTPPSTPEQPSHETHVSVITTPTEAAMPCPSPSMAPTTLYPRSPSARPAVSPVPPETVNVEVEVAEQRVLHDGYVTPSPSSGIQSPELKRGRLSEMAGAAQTVHYHFSPESSIGRDSSSLSTKSFTPGRPTTTGHLRMTQTPPDRSTTSFALVDPNTRASSSSSMPILPPVVGGDVPGTAPNGSMAAITDRPSLSPTQYARPLEASQPDLRLAATVGPPDPRLAATVAPVPQSLPIRDQETVVVPRQEYEEMIQRHALALVRANNEVEQAQQLVRREELEARGQGELNMASQIAIRSLTGNTVADIRRQVEADRGEQVEAALQSQQVELIRRVETFEQNYYERAINSQKQLAIQYKSEAEQEVQLAQRHAHADALVSQQTQARQFAEAIQRQREYFEQQLAAEKQQKMEADEEMCKQKARHFKELNDVQTRSRSSTMEAIQEHAVPAVTVPTEEQEAAIRLPFQEEITSEKKAHEENMAHQRHRAEQRFQEIQGLHMEHIAQLQQQCSQLAEQNIQLRLQSREVLGGNAVNDTEMVSYAEMPTLCPTKGDNGGSSTTAGVSNSSGTRQTSPGSTYAPVPQKFEHGEHNVIGYQSEAQQNELLKRYVALLSQTATATTTSTVLGGSSGSGGNNGSKGPGGPAQPPDGDKSGGRKDPENKGPGGPGGGGPGGGPPDKPPNDADGKDDKAEKDKRKKKSKKDGSGGDPGSGPESSGSSSSSGSSHSRGRRSDRNSNTKEASKIEVPRHFPGLPEMADWEYKVFNAIDVASGRADNEAYEWSLGVKDNDATAEWFKPSLVPRKMKTLDKKLSKALYKVALATRNESQLSADIVVNCRKLVEHEKRFMGGLEMMFMIIHYHKPTEKAPMQVYLFERIQNIRLENDDLQK